MGRHNPRKDAAMLEKGLMRTLNVGKVYIDILYM